MRTKQEVENSIRSAKCFQDLKEAMLELLDIIQDPVDVLSYEDRDIELISERISNIETCLDEDNPKINSERLRR